MIPGARIENCAPCAVWGSMSGDVSRNDTVGASSNLDWTTPSRRLWSLFSVRASAWIDVATTQPFWMRADPRITEVLPTASLGTCRKASFSRTRYPANDSAATIRHVPSLAAVERGCAGGAATSDAAARSGRDLAQR